MKVNVSLLVTSALFLLNIVLGCGKPKVVRRLTGDWKIENSFFIIDSTSTVNSNTTIPIEKNGTLVLNTTETDAQLAFKYLTGNITFNGPAIDGVPQSADILWESNNDADFGKKGIWTFSIYFSNEVFYNPNISSNVPKGYGGRFDVVENKKKQSYSFSGNLNYYDYSLPNLRWTFNLVKS